MRLHDLKPDEGAVTKSGKRVGRGIGSGKGRSATRGTKGAKSRSGYSKKVGFEGGQTPLQKRLPKFGFHNINQKKYTIINIDRLQELVDEGGIENEVDVEKFKQLGVLGKNDELKVLGRGELSAKLTIKAHKFTISAKEAIENAGGQAIVI